MHTCSGGGGRRELSSQKSQNKSPDSLESVWQVAHIDLVIREQKSTGFSSPDSPSAALSLVQRTPPRSVTVRYPQQKASAESSYVNMMAQSSLLSAINRQKAAVSARALTFDNQI